MDLKALVTVILYLFTKSKVHIGKVRGERRIRSCFEYQFVLFNHGWQIYVNQLI